MSIALRSRRRAIALTLALVAGVGTLIVANPAQAQVPDIETGADARKNCPADVAAPGQTITCAFAVQNTGNVAATVTALTETVPANALGQPLPGSTVLNLSCTVPGGAVIDAGDTLQPGQLCVGTFPLTVPNNAACGTGLVDAVTIAIAYPGTALTAGAFATETTQVVCPEITITKTADELSKVGDSVTYTFVICNVGDIIVNRGSVTDTVLGDLTAFFPATLTPDQCVTVVRMRTVVAGDLDPLVNTVTATYSAGTATDTATATDSTNLFQPSVDVTKSCSPDPNEVGGVSTCTIVVTNTSSADSPGLEGGTINDTLTGNLLAAGNTAVVSNTCTATLAVGASCTITTARTILATDPNPVVNTVTVHYNPVGFPNDITDTATASVDLVAPDITITKTADELSKVGDPVTYTFVICNAGVFPVSRTSVTDTVLGDLTAFFPATLTPDQCVTVVRTRTVAPGDLDPLVNTVTAVYSGAGASDTATATDSTNLFQPSVDVTKSCGPDPIQVGQAELCTIVVTNTSSADSPGLEGASISDTLTGNLLAAGNTAVVSNTCTATLAVGASCTITTTRTVIATDPSPLINTVTVHYNPVGFPNDITDSATDQVIIETPGGEGCTPGFWKQSQHFDSWVGFSPNQSFNTVFGVNVTLSGGTTLLDALNSGGGGINALARHAVAALLNASSPDVDSEFTTAEVIALVQDAVAPGGITIEEAHQLLAAANELGCPLN